MSDSFYVRLFSNPAKSENFKVGRTLVDLTPQVYKDAIRTRQVKQRWVLANILLVVIAAFATIALLLSNAPLKVQLESQYESNKQLQQSLQEYQELNVAIEQKDALEKKLYMASGGELKWTKLFTAIDKALPSGTSIKAIGINADAASKDRGAALLINFTAESPLGYADTLRAVQSADGVSNVQIGGMVSAGEGYEFSATLNYDDSIKTNRFPALQGGSN